MRRLSAMLGLASLAALGAASCRTTSAACEAYCEAVAEALARCDLVDGISAFDRTDCEERTLDVSAGTCTETALELALIPVDDCARVVESFCPDETLECPAECFGDCCTDADCPADLPACQFGSCKACTEETAATYCGPTMSCYLEQCVECTVETESFACPADEGCDYYHCRTRCLEAPDCGEFRVCSVGFCSEPVGTPCPEGDFAACGAGSCESVNAANTPVAPYCSIFCGEPQDCPVGYSCIDYTCLQD